jgi:hypothetical protein
MFPARHAVWENKTTRAKTLRRQGSPSRYSSLRVLASWSEIVRSLEHRYITQNKGNIPLDRRFTHAGRRVELFCAIDLTLNPKVCYR